MAKGNLFLGTAAKSVGDVVMYRREGSQVSRVRVRKIANPKTDAQCKQRAIMAPIPKFYSPLAIVLERSFEGLSKSKSYSKFLKVNADKARANDWLLPKGTTFFPLPYQLSSGSLGSVACKYDNENECLNMGVGLVGGEETTVGHLSKAFIAAGFQNGDVVTVIAIFGNSTNKPYAPTSFQFEIDDTSKALIETLGDANANVQADDTAGWSVTNEQADIVAGAVIVSRFENDKWRRTVQSLSVKQSIITAISTDAAKTAAIESYRGTVDGGNPLVYLDGEELQ